MADLSIPQPKKCSKCGEWFPATTEYFHKQGDGLYSYCKVCTKAYAAHYRAEHAKERREYRVRYNAEHKDDRRAYDARYNAEHPDERRASTVRWRIEHPEARRAQRARYATERREDLRAYAARYRAEHVEEAREYRMRYNAEKPEVAKAAIHRYRARKRELPNTLTAQEWQRCLDYFGGKCAYCGKAEDFWTVIAAEHYIAIKDPRADNPGTVATNIVPACHGRKGVPTGDPCCNQSKGNKDPLEWLVERFGKRKARDIQARIEAYFAWVS